MEAASIAPELALAIGSMALLMLGVFRRRHATAVLTWLAVALFVLAGGPGAHHTQRGAAFNGAFSSMTSRAS